MLVAIFGSAASTHCPQCYALLDGPRLGPLTLPHFKTCIRYYVQQTPAQSILKQERAVMTGASGWVDRALSTSSSFVLADATPKGVCRR